MPSSTWSSRAFNQNTNGAKAAAEHGPVIITQRGTPAHVLMTYRRYVALTRQEPTLVDLLAMADECEAPLEFEPPAYSPAFKPATFD